MKKILACMLSILIIMSLVGCTVGEPTEIKDIPTDTTIMAD